MNRMNVLFVVAWALGSAGCGASSGNPIVETPSADASLASLTTSAGPLSPAFQPAVLSYTVSAGVATETTITATPTDASASMEVGGEALLPGVPSAPVPLAVGLTPVDVVVTAADGTTTRTYTVVFERLATPLAQEAYVKGPVARSGLAFGSAVALSGDTLVVSSQNDASPAVGIDGDPTGTGATLSGAAWVFVRVGGVWSQQAYLKASNAQMFDLFGLSVAISGDTIVVGAPGEDSAATGVGGSQVDDSASRAGAAYVFVRSGATWTQQAYLKASNTGPNDSFGTSVAIEGDTIVVGADGEASGVPGVDAGPLDDSADHAGAAYVFVRSGTVWTQQAYLKASNPDAFDLFGRSVGVSGDTVVVGADQEASAATGIGGNQADDSAPSAGAAYVFVRVGDVWSQQAYLKASNSGEGDHFGFAVAASGDTLLVAAPNEDSTATGIGGDGSLNGALDWDSGAVYVFVRTGATWSQQAYVKGSNTGQSDQFGYSIGLSGNLLVVGAFGEDGSATGVDGPVDEAANSAGAAYRLERTGSTWAETAYVKASNTQSADFFGHSSACSGDTLAVGAVGEASSATGVGGVQADEGALGSGAVYVYR